MPDDVLSVVEAAGFRQKHLNLALFALDADGKLLRSSNPYVRPPAFRFDPDAMGRDFRRQLDDMLDGLALPKAAATHPPKLTLPDVTGDGRPAGVRVYLTFAKNRLNHYRTPTVEAVKWTSAMRDALRYPAERRTVETEALRPVLEQLYPPAIMDGQGGCRRIDADLTLTPAGGEGGTRYAVLKGTVGIELDNANRTAYSGPLSLVVSYDTIDPAARTLRGVGTWRVPKHRPEGRVAETIPMTAAIESRPD